MARHSQRPGKQQWQQLEHSRGLEAFLQMARQSTLAEWIHHFETAHDSAAWERSLRADWQRYLSHLVSWTPPRWQPSLAWIGVLPCLPGIARVLAGAAPADWMRDEEFFLGMSLDNPEVFRSELASGPWALLLEFWEDNPPLTAWWLAWQTLWPENHEGCIKALEPGWVLLNQPGGQQSEELEKFFITVLRTQQPTVLPVTAHLGLVSLDLGRLRGNLLSRQLRVQQSRSMA
jgi:hypothetical protein